MHYLERRGWVKEKKYKKKMYARIFSKRKAQNGKKGKGITIDEFKGKRYLSFLARKTLCNGRQVLIYFTNKVECCKIGERAWLFGTPRKVSSVFYCGCDTVVGARYNQWAREKRLLRDARGALRRIILRISDRQCYPEGSRLRVRTWCVI